LFRQTALMIQHGVLEMDVIYNLLGPTDEDIRTLADKEMSESKEFVRKMNVVSTNQDSTANKDDSIDSLNDSPESRVASNQKFGLLKALLDVGAWSYAERLIAR
jgi:THO complex subunit 2